MNKAVVLELKNISKQFTNHIALKDISLSLHQGEILGFLGPSGAGKTTTIKIITGQMVQSGGEAYIFDNDTRKITEAIYEKIGIVTDQSGFYERLTVYENLEVFAEVLNVSKSKIPQLLERVSLEKQVKQKAGKLSKGQSQRLVLARAVLHSPQVLFLDEPTSGLDPTTAMEVHKLLLEFKSQGMAIFLTTHNMDEATKLCDQVALLNKGHIVEFGSPKEISLKHNQEKEYKVTLESGQEWTLENNEHTAQ